MFARFTVLAVVLPLLAGRSLSAAPHAGEWKEVELLSFKDFDDLEVKMDGKTFKAFLVGLRPLRETKTAKEQDRIRTAVTALLKKSELSAQVVTRRGETLGLSLDAFAHRKHSFDHEWHPQRYSYCSTGWGAYNFNLYFWDRRFTTLHDNFGDNKYWKDFFEKVSKEDRPRKIDS